MIPMDAEDRRWQAEADARTIAEAAAIREDPHKYAAAQEAASRLAEESEAKNKAMKKLGEGDWPLNYRETLKVAGKVD